MGQVEELTRMYAIGLEVGLRRLSDYRSRDYRSCVIIGRLFKKMINNSSSTIAERKKVNH